MVVRLDHEFPPKDKMLPMLQGGDNDQQLLVIDRVVALRTVELLAVVGHGTAILLEDRANCYVASVGDNFERIVP